MSQELRELSNDELVRMAPSIGQTRPYKDASDRYSFIPTLDAVNYLRDSGWKPVLAGQSMVRDTTKDGFQKHMIRFTRPDLVMNGHRADILLYNAHDVSATFKLRGGFFRFVCSNGLVVGEDIASVTHRHMGFNIDQFIEDANAFQKTLEVAGGMVENWNTLELEKNEQGIYAQAASQLLWPDGCSVEPENFLQARRPEDAKRTDLWHTMNIVQENIIRGGLEGRSANGRRVQTRGITAIDRDREVNQTLWQISHNMASLKAA